MSLRIPASLAEKAAQFPESSCGAYKVTVVLSSGRVVDDVLLAWGSEVVKVRGRTVATEEDLSFRLLEVTDVLPYK